MRRWRFSLPALPVAVMVALAWLAPLDAAASLPTSACSARWGVSQRPAPSTRSFLSSSGQTGGRVIKNSDCQAVSSTALGTRQNQNFINFPFHKLDLKPLGSTPEHVNFLLHGEPLPVGFSMLVSWINIRAMEKIGFAVG